MKFFSRGIAALALIGGLGFAHVASAQTFCPSGCTLDLDVNGGLAVGGGAMDLDVSAGGSGSTSGVGNVVQRDSFADSAVLAKGELGIDSNHNRTNVMFDGSVYGGAAAQNTIKTNGANAGTTSSSSVAGVNGSINYGAGGLNLGGSASGGISIP